MVTLSDRMKAEAVGLGLCQQWTDEWDDDSSKDVMLDKMVRGLDFCLKHNFPSTDVLKRELDDDLCRRHNIYADDDNIQLDSPKHAVICGESRCDALVMGRMSEIDVRHISSIRLKAVMGARVWLNLHDYASADIICESGAKVFVHSYGDNCINGSDRYAGISVKYRKGFYAEKLYRR